jgi:hypothetical protein
VGGERLPYLLAKLKPPRFPERLDATAALAREEGWPYEQFLEALLEAAVFARDACGAHASGTRRFTIANAPSPGVGSRPCRSAQ